MVAKQKDKKKKGDGGEIGARGGPAGAGPGSAVHCLACQDKLSLDHHAAFFDAIVDLIPAKYYIGSLNEAGGAVPSKFIKKSAKADVKALFKASGVYRDSATSDHLRAAFM